MRSSSSPRPAGLRYATFVLDDGVSFVHMASSRDDGPNPLREVAAFQAFQQDVAERCAEPPVTGELQRDRLVPLLAMNPVVHLELHTSDLPRARETYAQLCAGAASRCRPAAAPIWRWGWAKRFGGGIVECAVQRARCGCPMCRCDEIGAATARARELGASVLLEPREGPAGWRAVVSTPAGGEIAFWQPKVWAA